MRALNAILLSALLPWTAAGANSFRVTPYVQCPATNAISLLWLASTNGDATVEWWRQGGTVTNRLAAERIEPTSRVANSRFTADMRLQYCHAPEFAYDTSPEAADNSPSRQGAWEMPFTVPWQYRCRLTGLATGSTYGYRVTLEGGAVYENRFRTAPGPAQGFKFIYYSDSETEPADNALSTGRTTDWDDPRTGSPRTYYATQTEAYASNLCAVADFGADLIVMAGDLAQKGSRQCDWDEFWRHNAGPLNDPAGSIPILASPGNHDYWSYNDGGESGMRKYLSYFEYNVNGTALDPDQQERFHRLDYGPVTFLFLDANNGDDSDPLKDTNHTIYRGGSGTYHGTRAPDFNPGSVQYQWLEAQLKDAQRRSAFIFVVSHQCPYSCGYHGCSPDKNNPEGERYDNLSGRPLRALVPMFLKYGVDGWLAGHDEMMERSWVEGVETLPDGSTRAHGFNVWDMGIAGDGLRGSSLCVNANERYRAHVNCPEVYENGTLVAGGKHYGHLEVTIDQAADGRWRATLDPVYVFFSQDASGKSVYGGVRHYADKVVLESAFGPGPAPGPQPASGGTRLMVW